MFDKLFLAGRSTSKLDKNILYTYRKNTNLISPIYKLVKVCMIFPFLFLKK